MSLPRKKSFFSLAMLVILALPVVGVALLDAPASARCPIGLTCGGNYSTAIAEGTAIGYSINYSYCEQARANAQSFASLDLLNRGNAQCGDFKKACSQQWVHDAGCYSEDLGNGTYLFRMYGHYTFGCKICAPAIPHVEDANGD